MTWGDRRKRFRAVLKGAQCVSPAAIFDPISARVAEELGFEVALMPGSLAALALGLPDLAVITLTEFAEQVLRISRVTAMPLLVDADHGYGNALSVMRTIEELEIAGVSAMTIEDTWLPAPYGSGGKMQLIPIAEGVGKMRAALAARRDPDLAIVGRTGALNVATVEEAIARAKAYVEAGVDAIFFSGMKTKAQLEAIAPQIKAPIILGLATPELADRAYLAKHGVRLNHQGHQSYLASVQAVHTTLKTLRDGGSPGELKNLASGDLMKTLVREKDYAGWSKDFLG